MGFRVAMLVAAVLAGLASGYAGMALAQGGGGHARAAHAVAGGAEGSDHRGVS